MAALSLNGCVAPGERPAAMAAERRAPVTILVSIDGFRPDYRSRGVTPTLDALAAAGVSAAMRPSFPSKTFPNHWTIVTGLRPDRNGIVANKMEDARRPGETFTMASDDPFWWNEATPIWVDAERAGIRSATMFWPGSNVAVGGARAEAWPHALTGGVRPHDWQQYNEAISPEQRVNAVLDLLRRPEGIRPKFLTLYYEAVDTAGHEHGPDAAETTAAVAGVDRSIGQLVAGLRAMGQPVNFVIVADHGMAATSSTRTIALDRVADPADYRIVENGPYASLAAMPGRERALESRLLRPQDHMTCWRKADIPARFAYGRNPRVPPYLCLAEVGWTIEKTAPKAEDHGGAHGYDNAAPEMAALFIASGPAIRNAGTLAPFDNVDVNPLLRDLIGLPPATGIDGDDAPFRTILKR
ncbi:ectonucleotide pyrophosphatase/phosphodiesterase [Sphingomonas donggukensis]|uniref:Ectonucleotide pyrophosphatase/phosphodiesterase n=2 Tax=Sphingomonas donggukensis TaxID=2949093 RepID=A0ABY4TXH2_9SPHN|nr:ectonucleotide pyrophosphatase/phosphodiesterase [Sphingomonas donggukensis]URW77102.1 ectonucleotide pyrophosphatase/phosphodiesterase [Sphingomonas donggukensis]